MFEKFVDYSTRSTDTVMQVDSTIFQNLAKESVSVNSLVPGQHIRRFYEAGTPNGAVQVIPRRCDSDGPGAHGAAGKRRRGLESRSGGSLGTFLRRATASPYSTHY